MRHLARHQSGQRHEGTACHRPSGLSVRWRPAHGLRRATRFAPTLAHCSRVVLRESFACGAPMSILRPALRGGLPGKVSAEKVVPNPAVERTPNGGARWLVAHAGSAPLVAAHGER